MLNKVPTQSKLLSFYQRNAGPSPFPSSVSIAPNIQPIIPVRSEEIEVVHRGPGKEILLYLFIPFSEIIA